MPIVRHDGPPKRPSPEELARLEALTADEIEANAVADPDNPPLTDDELARGVFARRVRRLRNKMNLSQSEFAERYRVNLRRLQDWEQGRFQPDSVVLAYLSVIENEPKAVARALAKTAA